MWVKFWTKNKPVLIATEVSDQLEVNDRVKVVVSDALTGLEKSITLIYSEEKCIAMSPEDAGGWAERAIVNGRTAINDKELSEFLNKTGNTSFRFFKLKGKDDGIVRRYLMALADDPVPDRIEKSNKEVAPQTIKKDSANEPTVFDRKEENMEMLQQLLVKER